MSELIVNLDEFSELCGVTSETMRAHFRAVVGNPAWLVERGDRGRGYKIEASGGLEWWRAKRQREEDADADHQARLRQLRFDELGDQADSEEALGMSGKQRREEYAAVLERIKLRRLMGELVERDQIEAILTATAISARRRLQSIPSEFAARMDMSQDEVKPLAELIERAVTELVDGLALPVKTENHGA